MFDRTERIDIEGYGAFEGYANRDSLSYRSIYGLEDIDTMYRGTFRRPPFCSGWHMLVQLGMTDDEMLIEEGMTYRDFTNLFLKYRDYDSVELKMAHYLDTKVNSEPMQLLEWLGLFFRSTRSTKEGFSSQNIARFVRGKVALRARRQGYDRDVA